jgi:hypothetical protein
LRKKRDSEVVYMAQVDIERKETCKKNTWKIYFVSEAALSSHFRRKRDSGTACLLGEYGLHQVVIYKERKGYVTEKSYEKIYFHMRLEHSPLFNKKFLEEVTMPVLVPQIVTDMMRIQK